MIAVSIGISMVTMYADGVYWCSGSHVVVALAQDEPRNIIDRGEFKTTTPDETLAACVAWYVASAR
jgi:hypothetical protein